MHGIYNGADSGADIGLSIDTVFALAPFPVHAATVDDLGSAIESGYWTSYIQYSGVFYANSTAKALVAARVLRRPGNDFGGHSLRRKLMSMVAPSGRVRDTDWKTATDYSNTLGQALAVIGLARSGGAPQRAVDFLAGQQCRSGGFALTESAHHPCARAGVRASVDATGLAVQALVAARRHGAAVPQNSILHAIRWLRSVQKRNGGFAQGGGAARPNTNSTGLAAAAFAATGRDRALRRAARFVASMQLTASTAGNAAADAGAIAYNASAFNAAVAGGVTVQTRDQFRRATAQAMLALTGRHLDVLHRR
jgi:prenyltransferase beta subunit